MRLEMHTKHAVPIHCVTLGLTGFTMVGGSQPSNFADGR